jgi:hypothetical protein
VPLKASESFYYNPSPAYLLSPCTRTRLGDPSPISLASAVRGPFARAPALALELARAGQLQLQLTHPHSHMHAGAHVHVHTNRHHRPHHGPARSRGPSNPAARRSCSHSVGRGGAGAIVGRVHTSPSSRKARHDHELDWLKFRKPLQPNRLGEYDNELAGQSSRDLSQKKALDVPVMRVEAARLRGTRAGRCKRDKSNTSHIRSL